MEYENLLACFRSGQMNEKQLFEHMKADEKFAEFVLKNLKGAQTDE